MLTSQLGIYCDQCEVTVHSIFFYTASSNVMYVVVATSLQYLHRQNAVAADRLSVLTENMATKNSFSAHYTNVDCKHLVRVATLY